MDANGSNDGSAAAAAEFSKASQDLARGEATATALESQLSRLEKKLDMLLESVKDGAVDEADVKAEKQTSSGSEKN
ncbi:MAG: 26S proteasome subunit rpt4 [Watsoniomyces obsoletus]|nr:MAG: 26S proteasome subunit rpt4 [Watsoniomyces obsoletus]